jgi:elongation factor Ts
LEGEKDLPISSEQVKELREKTGVGIMDCKAALQASHGDMAKAIEYLRKKGIATARKRETRAASQGQVHAYIHGGGKIGVLVEVNCETDFSAKTDDFANFVKDVAMQIAAANPIAVDRDRIPADLIEKEKEIYATQARESGKSGKVIEKMVEGKLKKFFSEACLLEQPFIKNPEISVQDLLNDLIAKTGENVVIRRYVRFQLGGSDE